ncbi:MAG: HlyD family secretion protein [Vicinamibacteria bacterium]
MLQKKPRLIVAVGLLLALAACLLLRLRPAPLVLTGVVTTNDVVVSSQVGGQIGRLLVTEGDPVKKDQVLALIVPDELRADTAYYAHSAEGASAQVRASEADLRFQEKQTADQILQAESNLASTMAQAASAAADRKQARITFERSRDLNRQGIVSQQDLDQAQAAADASEARLLSLEKQTEAQRAALAMARSTADQIKVKRGQLETNEQMQRAAAAQSTKADVRLRYTELRAPIDGIVDVRAAREGEVVTAGQAVVTLVNPDDLWVRADVEESYIDGVRIGDKRTIRLPSGAEREGTVVFRGVDAAFATQRDVSRTKRDIRTFEVRLRADNADRRLALGMTAYVLLPATAR